MELFIGLHRGQARAYRIAQRSLLRRIDEAVAIADEQGVHWLMPEDMRKELAEISQFLSKSSSALVQVHDANTKVTAGLSTELLEAQLRSEFVMAAKTFSEEEWGVLEKIRAGIVARRRSPIWQTSGGKP